eukprot:9164411-Alexandrium_andersonii.AAC.1
MPTPCQRHANVMPTPCQRHANAMPTLCHPPSCCPHAHPHSHPHPHPPRAAFMCGCGCANDTCPQHKETSRMCWLIAASSAASWPGRSRKRQMRLPTALAKEAPNALANLQARSA